MENAVENAREALDKFLFFRTNRSEAHPRDVSRGNTLLLFFPPLFPFREALSPLAARTLHFSGGVPSRQRTEKSLSCATALNREKHEVLNIFRAIVSRSHGDNSGQSATFRYGRIARTAYKERVDDF